MSMSIPKIGFSSNYCIQVSCPNESSCLTEGINKVDRDKVFASKDENKVYVTTNGRQFSLEDLNLLKKGLQRAGDNIKKIYIPVGIKSNPFGEDSDIYKNINTAFEQHAEKTGFIGNA